MIFTIWHHNKVFWWHHTRHMCDIICTTDDITLSLSHQITVFMISHPLQAWHHTHCIRHHTQCISFITNSPLISHPHLYDITPTICVTSYSPYTTSHPLLMSSYYLLMTSKPLYKKPHPVCRSTYTLYMWHHSHCSVSSHPLFWHHHTHSLYDITLGIWMANFALYKTSHPHTMASNLHFYDITPTIFEIVSSVYL